MNIIQGIIELFIVNTNGNSIQLCQSFFALHWMSSYSLKQQNNLSTEKNSLAEKLQKWYLHTNYAHAIFPLIGQVSFMEMNSLIVKNQW